MILYKQEIRILRVFFPFSFCCKTGVHLINTRPGWRQWAGFGLIQCFRTMWTTVKHRKEPFILMHIHFTCVTHARPLCIFEGRVNLQYVGASCISFLFVVLAVSSYDTERRTGSLFYFDNNIDLVTVPLSLCTLLIIKSYHSPALLCWIHLQLSFNHSHTALVLHLQNWLDLAINVIYWL